MHVRVRGVALIASYLVAACAPSANAPDDGAAETDGGSGTQTDTEQSGSSGTDSTEECASEPDPSAVSVSVTSLDDSDPTYYIDWFNSSGEEFSGAATVSSVESYGRATFAFSDPAMASRTLTISSSTDAVPWVTDDEVWLEGKAGLDDTSGVEGWFLDPKHLTVRDQEGGTISALVYSGSFEFFDTGFFEDRLGIATSLSEFCSGTDTCGRPFTLHETVFETAPPISLPPGHGAALSIDSQEYDVSASAVSTWPTACEDYTGGDDYTYIGGDIFWMNLLERVPGGA